MPLLLFIKTEKQIAMPSKVVFIRRKIGDSRIPQDVYAESSKKIGSYFEGSKVGGRLPISLEKQILPVILGIDPNDFTYNKLVSDFYADLVTAIPFGEEGLRLEIGLGDDELPLNDMDYIRYHHAKRHPMVAESSETAQPQRIKWFIFDPTIKEKKEEVSLNLKIQATQEFAKILNDEEKLAQILTLYGERDTRSLAKTKKQLLLSNYMDQSHGQFIKYATDKNLETLAFINDLISAEILSKVGNAIYDGEEKIGDDTDGAVKYLKDKKNSATLVRLKARLDAFGRI